MTSAASRHTRTAQSHSSAAGKGAITNNLHSNSAGPARTAAKKQQLDTVGKGMASKMDTAGKNDSSSDAGMTRTTMIVKLHPGQAKRLSAYLEGQQTFDSAVHLRDPAEQEDADKNSICGL